MRREEEERGRRLRRDMHLEDAGGFFVHEKVRIQQRAPVELALVCNTEKGRRRIHQGNERIRRKPICQLAIPKLRGT